jgi:hypothetical protein
MADAARGKQRDTTAHAIISLLRWSDQSLTPTGLLDKMSEDKVIELLTFPPRSL